MTTTNQIINLKKPKLKADILEVLKNRFSPRVFSDEKIIDKDLNSIFEAARWAPSSRNRQPWFFYLTKKSSKYFYKFMSVMNESNEWAANSAVLILACYIKEDESGKNRAALYDLGQAIFSLVVQAQSLGYYTHQIGGFDIEKIKKIITFEKNIEPFVFITVGKIGDYSKANKILVAKDNKERERKENYFTEI